MSTIYTINFSDITKSPIIVQPGTKDTDSTTLTLTGRGSANWGRDLQENLIWLLENFADDNPPVNPVEGQLWYNNVTKKLLIYSKNNSNVLTWNSVSGAVTASATAPSGPQVGQMWFDISNGKLFIFDGTSWKQVYPSKEYVKVAFVEEYNAIVSNLNLILGTPTGTTLATAYGYNQGTIPTETLATLTNAKWLSLLQVITNLTTLLGLPTTGINTTGFIYEPDNTIVKGIVTLIAEYNTTLTAVSNLLAGTNRFNPILAAQETLMPASGTRTRTTVWSGAITHDVTVSFATESALKGFFNSGGRFKMFATLTNAVTARDTAYSNFLNSLGTISWGATGTTGGAGTNATGLYGINSSALTTIYSANMPPSVYFNNGSSYTLQARYITDNKTLLFRATYNNPGTLYGGVGGTLTSRASTTKVSNVYLNNPVISHPTMTSAGTM